ncbi:MAG: prolipoprotein diacylglyceryl transferase [Micromonosporaceae bacterium]|nr:prolipoprotein diacylglyceryl transferase [Micromonosporaceae bacterium]
MPSPTTAVWDLGGVPIRAYALFIVAGIIVACVVTEARLRARGAPRYTVLDLAVWAVPFGIVGARLYHVITSPDRFFGEGGSPVEILYVWNGGLGIWGGIAGGAVGVWLACRQMKLPFRVVADASAVGIPLAQAVGRLGNWFNNELYGARTTLPWGLEVHQMEDGQAVPNSVNGELVLPGLYHPAFLYEALWSIGVAILVWQVGNWLRLGRGRQFALYVMAYTAGRFWIELLRIDDTADVPTLDAADTVMTILGQRVNVWVSALVFLGALVYFLRVRGPQEFLVPVDEDRGFRVVTEPEFRQWELTAAEPADPTGAPAPEEPTGPVTGDEPTARVTGEPPPGATRRGPDDDA